MEKDKNYNGNKISKLIYFFFTLQNQGIPVNEIYERDGVKAIKTDRFQEIMGQNAEQDSRREQEHDYSFYSDDSYEYCPFSDDLHEVSRFVACECLGETPKR